MPTLRVRKAAVEDHDDLVPIFNSQSEVLTELYGEFFLAELIESQVPLGFVRSVRFVAFLIQLDFATWTLFDTQTNLG